MKSLFFVTKLGGRGPWRAGAALLLAAAAALAACSPLKLLRPGQRLLSKMEVVGADRADQDRLVALAQQKPNTRFPLPKLAIYLLGNRFYDSVRTRRQLAAIRQDFEKRRLAAGDDSAKLGQLLNRRERKLNRKQLVLDKGNAIMRLGEAPVIYDSASTRRSVEQMTTYLRSQGYFRARVLATDTARYRHNLLLRLLAGRRAAADSADRAKLYRRVTVRYRVRQGAPFVVSQLTASIPDSGVAAVVARGQGASLLHVGDRYNEDAIGQERTRLETLLKSNGYYDFRQAYITLEADTSYQAFTVRLRTNIANPGPGLSHRVYTLRQVTVITDAGVGRSLRVAVADTLRRAGTGQRARPQRGPRLDTTVVDSVHFAAFQQRYSPRLLAGKVAVRPGQLYSLPRTQLTQRQFANLDMFRFNPVTYRNVEGAAGADSTATGLLDAVVTATPAPKFQESTEFGGTYVANLVGPFVNVRFKTRNPFGGAEVLELSTRVGFEGQYNRATARPEYTALFGATAALVLPQFLVPFRISRDFSRYSPRTRFSLSDTYVSRPEYTRTNVELTYDYIWQRSAFHQFVISPVVQNVVNTTSISQDFQQRLDTLRIRDGSPLYQSFRRIYEPSMAASSLFNSNDFNETRDARYFRLFVEVGGLTRDLYRHAAWYDTAVAVYNFAKITADYRRYHKLSPNTFLVYRFNGGLVHALTPTAGRYTVAYDKYLFAGGSNSVRAWKPRRLGIGGFSPTTTNPDGSVVRDYNSEQPGELLLEGSVEYRFPVYSFVKGAIFTDYGNTWTVTADPQRPGAQFAFNSFLKQFAVGSGVGVRLDFTFLILRLDVAAKVYDPSAPADARWAIKRFYKDSEHEPAFNLGIGYPF
ncbi:translocation and assembly module lipoprotein TamL [Hymenobacter sp. PAMC 26628]|uniref:translocation and assembly module lipoprotein TamL n=1 Tax=Hymenobacter sp. PAMC 26628 TaxID=1484118 RepID=UPI0012FF788F|nr:BamA/TamA family outer membrane protein [Hymenobacter sp. PAMC 26628]